MSRPLPEPAAAARAELPEGETPAFDRLAAAVLASAHAPLGPVLRAQLPGTAGVRWLRQEGLPTTARPSALTTAHWRSLYRCWSSEHQVPASGGSGGRRTGGRPSAHGHAPGAQSIPRWGQ